MTEVTVNAEDLKIVLNQTIVHARHDVPMFDSNGVACVECAARERLAKAIAPPIPEEPPRGTMLISAGNFVWRRTPKGMGNDVWRCIGNDRVYTWPEALTLGADPNRRLILASDPNDAEQVKHIVNYLKTYWGASIKDDEYYQVVMEILTEIGELND